MSDKAFVDANILVYAHDRSDARKFTMAVDLVQSLWELGDGVISTQVLQEFYVSVRRKLDHPMSVAEARTCVSDYLKWRVVVNDEYSITAAIEFEERYQLSFWDALIVQAANRANTTILYSEDLNHGQRYGDLRVENPFA